MGLIASVGLSAIIFCAPLAAASAIEDENDLPGTCQGFIRATEILRQLHDPVALVGYREISETSYETIKKIALQHKMKSLPLPTAPEDYARRLQALESTCLQEPSLVFREAVARTYLLMRHEAGLSNQIPK